MNAPLLTTVRRQKLRNNQPPLQVKAMMDFLSPLARAALAVVQESGSLLRDGFERPHEIRHKGRIDLVTETDLAVEAFLKKKLAPLLPETGFLAEESAKDLSLPDSCWIIDPVDGTTNFAHGLPLAVTSVGLWQKGEVVLGIVNAPLIGEWYIAEKGKGAWRNGGRLAVSTVDDCREALVATGFPYTVTECVDEILIRLREVLIRVQGVRRCGAAALDLAWLASGRFDTYYETGLKPWDVAAGALLVREAGGRLTTMDGSPHTLFSSVLATNGRLHPRMLELLTPDGSVADGNNAEIFSTTSGHSG